MAEERAQRRLAAILAADIAGYSRLMGVDEEGTLARLKDHRRELIDPKISEHRGRLVKTTGDGMLVEFASVVDAVRCAIEVQVGMAERNTTVGPAEQIQFRIGINFGDIIIDGGDIYGDGVNVAARLEGLADPGGICVSGRVQEDVRGKLDVTLKDEGEQQLKNIAWPVRVCRVHLGGKAAAAHPVLPLRGKPSIVVLPFTNMSGDPEQEYFSDGIIEDIITELSRFRELFVIARNSSFRFREKAVDVKRVARELGVQYVVEGSVRRLGDRIRITAQLIDAGSGSHLWAERFDRDQQDIFAVQDQVVRTIVATLVGRLESAGVEQVRRKPPASLAAYEYVLRGKAIALGNPEGEAEKRRLFEKAIVLDPTHGRAHALLAYVIFLEWFRDMSGSDTALNRAFEMAKKAAALDENDSTCQSALGWIHLFRRSFDLAEQYNQRALELNPNDPEQFVQMGGLYVFLGRPDEAIEWLKQAKLLDPYFNPVSYWHFLGAAHFVAGRYAEAITALSRSSTMPAWVQAYLAASHALANKIDRAMEFAAQLVRLTPDFSATRLAAKEPYKRPTDGEHLLDGLRKAGLPK